MGRKSKKALRRAEIIEAFAKVLADHGYAGATINAVAFEAGVAPGLLHHNFRDKKEMLNELFSTLIKKFRTNLEERRADAGSDLHAYIDAALKLDARADTITARCWVGVFAEALREPALLARVKRHLDREVKHLQQISGDSLANHECSAIIAFILGALVFGAFAPKRTSGFASPAGRRLVAMLAEGGE